MAYTPNVVYLWDAYDCVQTVGPNDPLVPNTAIVTYQGYSEYDYAAHFTLSGQSYYQEYVWALTLKAGKILTLDSGYGAIQFQIRISSGDQEAVAINGGSYSYKGPGGSTWNVSLANSGALTSIGVKASNYHGPFSMYFPNAVLSDAPADYRWTDRIGSLEEAAL